VKALALAALPFALAALLFVRGCSGPEPVVTATASARDGAGVVASATVRNDGGEGEVQVTFRLRDRASGRVVAGEAIAQLRSGEAAELTARIPTAPPGEFDLEAEAEYPPR
jgi:hypothetical protein